MRWGVSPEASAQGADGGRETRQEPAVLPFGGSLVGRPFDLFQEGFDFVRPVSARA